MPAPMMDISILDSDMSAIVMGRELTQHKSWQNLRDLEFKCVSNQD